MLMQAAVPRVAVAIDLVVFSNAFVVANGQSQLENIPPDGAAGLTALSQTTPDGRSRSNHWTPSFVRR